MSYSPDLIQYTIGIPDKTYVFQRDLTVRRIWDVQGVFVDFGR